MALSDTCSEVLEELQSEFVSYADWSYSPVELNRIITAMFELAYFMARQDIPPDRPINALDNAVNNIVIVNILAKAKTNNTESVCDNLSSICKLNQRLQEGVEALITKLSSQEGMLEVLKDPYIYDQLNKIKSSTGS